MKKILLFFCFVLIFGENRLITLDHIMTLAKRNNPILLSEKAKVKESKQHIQTVGVLPDPQISAGYFLEPVETKTGPQEFHLGLTQKIPWFNKLSNHKKIAVLQHEQSVLQLRKKELELEQLILNSIFELRFLNQKITILQENLALLLQMEQVVQTTYSAGKSHHSDIIQNPNHEHLVLI